MIKTVSLIWDELRQKRPLVHCISNYVTLNDVANVILASGASPAMCEYPEEAGEFARIANALYLNLGTLTAEQEAAMLAASKGAGQAHVPIVLDPVACGVIERKKTVYKSILKHGPISVIKGNTAEIKSLAGFSACAQGVDSLDDGKDIEKACMNLAQRDNCVVAATGKTDLIADSSRYAYLRNGTSLFEHITGAGCMLGGVLASCCAVHPEDAWMAALTAITAFNLAGEKAYALSGDNPGSFRISLVDQLYHLRGEDILEGAKIEWES